MKTIGRPEIKLVLNDLLYHNNLLLDGHIIQGNIQEKNIVAIRDLKYDLLQWFLSLQTYRYGETSIVLHLQYSNNDSTAELFHLSIVLNKYKWESKNPWKFKQFCEAQVKGINYHFMIDMLHLKRWIINYSSFLYSTSYLNISTCAQRPAI